MGPFSQHRLCLSTHLKACLLEQPLLMAPLPQPHSSDPSLNGGACHHAVRYRTDDEYTGPPSRNSENRTPFLSNCSNQQLPSPRGVMCREVVTRGRRWPGGLGRRRGTGGRVPGAGGRLSSVCTSLATAVSVKGPSFGSPGPVGYAGAVLGCTPHSTSFVNASHCFAAGICAFPRNPQDHLHKPGVLSAPGGDTPPN